MAVAAVIGTLSSTVATVLAWVRSHLLRMRVEGLSMVPVLGPGDRILVLRTHSLSIGDIAVLKDPDAPERTVVKRVTGVEWNSLRVEGDNLAASHDSRHFGAVPLEDVIGRVLWCYWTAYEPPATSRRASTRTTLKRKRDAGTV
jgi:nickel-type superoxide dismutase maturation protease